MTSATREETRAQADARRRELFGSVDICATRMPEGWWSVTVEGVEIHKVVKITHTLDPDGPMTALHFRGDYRVTGAR